MKFCGLSPIVFTRESLRLGIIPKQCPICKSYTGELVHHHWLGSGYWAKGRDGFYKRMCSSCNSLLGSIYKGEYPISWEEQFQVLCGRIKSYPGCYSNFDGEEGWWSSITGKEREEVRSRLVEEGSLEVALPKLTERKYYEYTIECAEYLVEMEQDCIIEIQARDFAEAVRKAGIKVRRGSGQPGRPRGD